MIRSNPGGYHTFGAVNRASKGQAERRLARGKTMMSAGSDSQSEQRMAEAGPAWILSDSAMKLLPTAACVCDAQGRLLRFNDKAVTLWGRAPEPADTWESVCGRGADAAELQTRIRQARPVANAVVALSRAGHARVTVLVNAEPIYEAGEHVGSVITFQKRPDETAPGAIPLWDTLDALPAAIYTADAEGRITFFNKAAADLWGTTPEIGSALWCGATKLYHPDGSVMPNDQCPMAVAIREQRPVRGVEAIVERPDGSRVAVLPHPTPLFDASGAFAGAVNMLVDITHHKVADERHFLFARELNHRVKNALATVYAIAMQTLRYTDSTETFRESFSTRLLALSRAHDLLVRSQWQETALRTIIVEALASFGSTRLEINGDDVAFGPRATLTLAMTLHELITNATRFGALSNMDGKIVIDWHTGRDEDGEPQVELAWREMGGPVVETPTHAGFGSRLISHNVMALGGAYSADYARDGFRCAMRLPVINEGPGWTGTPRTTSSTDRPSDGTAAQASPGEQVH